MNDLITISNTVKTAVDYIQQKGLPIPNKPTEPYFPDDISISNNNELGSYLGQWAALVSWAQVQVALNDINATAIKHQYDQESAKKYLEYKNDDHFKTQKEREAAILNHTDLNKLKFEVVKTDSIYKLSDALLKGYLQKYQALSRELTRRGIDINKGQY